MLALNLIVFGVSVRYADAFKPVGPPCCGPNLSCLSMSAGNVSLGQFNLVCCSNSMGSQSNCNVSLSPPGNTFLQRLDPVNEDGEQVASGVMARIREIVQQQKALVGELNELTAEAMGKPSGEATQLKLKSKIEEEDAEVDVSDMYNVPYQGGLGYQSILTRTNLDLLAAKLDDTDSDSTDTGFGDESYSGDDASSNGSGRTVAISI